MNVRKVVHTTHIWNYVVFALIGALVIVSLLVSFSGDAETLSDRAQPIFLLPLAFVSLLFLYLVYLIVSFWVLQIQMSQRKKNLKKAAKEKAMHASTFVPIGSALYSIMKKRPHFRNSFIGDSWAYTDFVFSELSENYKRERYTTNSYYFAVAAFDLPRALPNVFFDSRRSGRREFQFSFREDQRHDLEGDFHTHFATYFTEDYTIDSLSFITPEVMLALVDANQYDIEIFGNKLYLINELENMPDQLEDIEQKGKMIREKLLNNIVSYRDDRIDFSQGRKTISIAGLMLRRSSRKYINMALFGAASAVASGVGLWLGVDVQLALYGVIIGLGVTIYAATYVYDIQKTNRQLRIKSGLY